MWEHVRQAIARHGSWVWQRTGKVRDLLGLNAAKREQDHEDSRRRVARARFWTDMREGQREAERLKETGA